MKCYLDTIDIMGGNVVVPSEIIGIKRDPIMHPSMMQLTQTRIISNSSISEGA